MSDVKRDEFNKLLIDSIGCVLGAQLSDRILERFDVTPKPAVTEGDLASFMHNAFRNSEQQNGVLMNWNMNNVANRLVLELKREGLTIVRMEGNK